MLAQDAIAQSVESGNEHPGCGRGDEPLQSFAHFIGRAVGEGNGKNLLCGDALVRHEVRDAMRQRAGLASAGSGDDEQRAGRDFCGSALLGTVGRVVSAATAAVGAP